MKIKKEFSLKGQTWGVEYKWGLRSGGEKVDGLCQYSSRTIFIERALPKEEKWLVFLHELVHAVLHEAHVSQVEGGVDGLLEEVICESMSGVLDQLFTMRWKRGDRHG